MTPLLFAALNLVIMSLLYVIKTTIRINRKQKTFEHQSPNLPVAPNRSFLVGHLWNLMLHRHSYLIIHHTHSKLGPSFEFEAAGVINIATSDLELLKLIHIDEAADHLNRAQIRYPYEEIREDSIASASKEKWQRIRKAVAPAFSNHNVKSPNVQAEVHDVIDRYLDSLERRFDVDSCIEIDTENSFHRYALALVFRCFYKQSNEIDFDAEEDDWQRRASVGLRGVLSPLLKICLAYPILMYIVEPLLKLTPQGLSRKKLSSFVEDQTELNLKAKQAANKPAELNREQTPLINGEGLYKRNMVDHIIDQFHNGKLNQKEYINTSLFLFHAAHKTSADSISRLVYLLAHNQEKQDKLRKSVLQDGEESEYLAWSINEALRLYPPAPAGSARIISRDIETKNGLIPKGSNVISSVYTIHRLKEYWGDDAEDFRPERWANSKSFHPCQFMAFGVGRRNCPGGNFAVQEIKMLMNKMLRRYRFLPSPKTSGFIKFQSPLLIFSITEKPVYVRLQKLGVVTV